MKTKMTPPLQEVNGFVWCDYEGAVHVTDNDPYNYGPVLWTRTDRKPDRTFYHKGEGDKWYYVCPGDHRTLYIIVTMDESDPL